MISGPRVTLRALRREDLPRLNAFNNDLEVQLLAEFNPPRPQPVEVDQAEFEEHSRGGRGGVGFAIEVDGEFIGVCGLSEVHPAHGTAGLSILIGDKARWGQGLGREAIGLLLDYAFRIRNVRKVWLSTASANERAIGCYRACGFVEEGRQREQQWLNGEYVDVVYMGLLRSGWPGVA